MDVSSFTGPSKDPVSKTRPEDQNVNEVNEITALKDESPFEQASSVSLEVRDHPLQLLVRVVIDKLNDAFAHDQQPEKIQGITESDMSPDLAAKKISLHAISLYEPFSSTRQEENKSDVLDAFIDSLVKAVENGFDEAQTMLQNLGVLVGEVERDIDQTYLYVQGEIKAFMDTKAAD